MSKGHRKQGHPHPQKYSYPIIAKKYTDTRYNKRRSEYKVEHNFAGFLRDNFFRVQIDQAAHDDYYNNGLDKREG